MVWGEFKIDEEVQGGVMQLKGGDNNSDRVYAGPFRAEDQEQCGVVEVYTDDALIARIRGKVNNTGRVDLYGVRREAGQDKVASLTTLESAGAADPTQRWGRLILRSLVTDDTGLTDLAISTLELSAQGGLGAVRIFDASRPDDSFALLEIDERGPQLYMWAPNGRHIRISPEGIEQSPDKAPNDQPVAGDFLPGGIADAPPDAGVPGRDEVFIPGVQPELNLVAAHPEDPSLEIYYNVLEGPEVGVYVRGSIRLKDGRAIAALPDHFRHVASTEGITVQLTPRCALSKGVAATRVTLNELEVTELAGGLGEYDVDYVVHGIRRGRERFRTIRPKHTLRRPSQTRTDARENLDQERD